MVLHACDCVCVCVPSLCYLWLSESRKMGILPLTVFPWTTKHRETINVVTMVTTSNSLRLRVVVDAGREASDPVPSKQDMTSPPGFPRCLGGMTSHAPPSEHNEDFERCWGDQSAGQTGLHTSTNRPVRNNMERGDGSQSSSTVS